MVQFVRGTVLDGKSPPCVACLASEQNRVNVYRLRLAGAA